MHLKVYTRLKSNHRGYNLYCTEKSAWIAFISANVMYPAAFYNYGNLSTKISLECNPMPSLCFSVVWKLDLNCKSWLQHNLANACPPPFFTSPSSCLLWPLSSFQSQVKSTSELQDEQKLCFPHLRKELSIHTTICSWLSWPSHWRFTMLRLNQRSLLCDTTCYEAQ